MSDPGEDTSYEVSAHPRAGTEPLRMCRAWPLIYSIILGFSTLGPGQINVTPAPLFLLCVKKDGWGWLGSYLSSSNTQRITKGQPCLIENIYQQCVQKTSFGVIVLSLYQRTSEITLLSPTKDAKLTNHKAPAD